MKVKINVNLRVVSKIILIIILFISFKKIILESCDCLNKDLNFIFKGNLNNHGVNGILPSKNYSCCIVLELRSKFLNADELTTELLCK